MSDVVPLDEALAKYRKLISIQKEQLKKDTSAIFKLSQPPRGRIQESMADRISQKAAIMEDLYTNIEVRATVNAVLQVKLEGLRDIVYELKEVKESPKIHSKIRQLFTTTSLVFDIMWFLVSSFLVHLPKCLIMFNSYFCRYVDTIDAISLSFM